MRNFREQICGLHVLVDDGKWSNSLMSQATNALKGGANVLQLRAKTSTDRKLLEWSKALRRLTTSSNKLFFVNDRFDIALASEADGVHLGQNDLSPKMIPSEIRERLLIGRSTHNIEQVLRAKSDNVNYIAFGPIFPTQTKANGLSQRGLAHLKEAVVAARPTPVVAIGGITSDNVGSIVPSGTEGFAVISEVADSANPENTTKQLLAQFSEGRR